MADVERSLAQAKAEMDAAVQSLAPESEDSKDLASAVDQADEARQSLQRAYDQVRREMARAEQESAELAARQDYLQGQTQEQRRTAEAMRSSPNSSADPETMEQLSEALARAEQAMQQAGEQLSQGQRSEASSQQSEAQQSLQEALEQAEEALAQAQQNASRPQADESKRNELAERQQDIRERTRQLMQRLRDLQRPRGTDPLQAAERSMQRAERSLQEDDLAAAEEAEREAEKHLEEAERELQEEEERYEDLRQEELLYRVREELMAMRERSTALESEVARIDRERGGETRIPRRLRPDVARASDEAKAIGEANSEALTKLEEDSSPVFPWLLEKNGDDLERIADELSGRVPETGEFTQFLVADVVGRYSQLLDALEEEVDRRRKEQEQKQQQDGQQGPQQDPPQSLIPPVAELVLLQKLQEDLIQDMRGLRARSDEVGEEMGAARRRLLERMGHYQEEVFELFDTLLRQQGVDPEELGGE